MTTVTEQIESQQIPGCHMIQHASAVSFCRKTSSWLFGNPHTPVLLFLEDTSKLVYN